jgi:ATP-dependent DNA ligase
VAGQRPRPQHGWNLLIEDVGDDRRVHYCGVELGITSAVREELENRMQARQSSPFVEIVHEPGAHVVKPNVTAEIRFLERTSGHRLRHATFRQLGGRCYRWTRPPQLRWPLLGLRTVGVYGCGQARVGNDETYVIGEERRCTAR